MNELFVSYEIALKLKELGFDEKCLAFYAKEDLINSSNYQLNEGLLYPVEQQGEYYGSVQITSTEFNTSNINNWWEIAAPLYSQVFEFFREKYNLDSFCRTIDNTGKSYWKISKLYDDGNLKGYSDFTNTYKEAEIACINRLINIVNNK